MKRTTFLKTCTHKICRGARADELSDIIDESITRHDWEGVKQYENLLKQVPFEKVACRMVEDEHPT